MLTRRLGSDNPEGRTISRLCCPLPRLNSKTANLFVNNLSVRCSQ